MRLQFNEKQRALLARLELDFDPCGDLNDDQYFVLDEQVSDYFAMHGLAGNGDDVNETGRICESILDILSEA